MGVKLYPVVLLISAFLLGCGTDSPSTKYSEGYLGSVYELMPSTLQEIVDKDEFVDYCEALGINPEKPAITPESTKDLEPPTRLDDFLKKDRNKRSSEDEILKIASFNIQVFGMSKVGKEDVMINLVKILNEFDIIAIQEIRDKSGEAIEVLLDRMGRSTWGLTISPPIGRTISKEQYAFIYRKDKIDLDFCDTWPDPSDLLHREPYICSFQFDNFEFALINIHTDPDEVKEEINVLDDIYLQFEPQFDHLMLLGDLNAAPSQFDELTRIPNIAWAIPQQSKTNTRGTKNYSNILYNFTLLDEYHNSYVYDMQRELKISKRNALRISDHNPVIIEILLSKDEINL
jgi:endonuclease/exonuclease/phosphatase family metal-dependent hydrolase